MILVQLTLFLLSVTTLLCAVACRKLAKAIYVLTEKEDS